LANSNICWINPLLKKFAWKPILDAVNDREEGIKTHYFLLKMLEMKCKILLTTNVFYKKRLERDNMLKEAREMKEKWLLMLKMKRKFKDLK
jgi:F-type H+-transporting ATPase subunit b